MTRRPPSRLTIDVYTSIMRGVPNRRCRMTSHVGSSPRRLALFTLGWLALAVVVAASGRLAAIPFPGPQLVLVGLAALSLFLGTSVGSVRAWVDAVPLRGLVGVHAVRLVGFAFLALAARGQLSPVF